MFFKIKIALSLLTGIVLLVTYKKRIRAHYLCVAKSHMELLLTSQQNAARFFQEVLEIMQKYPITPKDLGFDDLKSMCEIALNSSELYLQEQRLLYSRLKESFNEVGRRYFQATSFSLPVNVNDFALVGERLNNFSRHLVIIEGEHILFKKRIQSIP